LIEEFDFFEKLCKLVGVGLCGVWLGQGTCATIRHSSMVFHRLGVKYPAKFGLVQRLQLFKLFVAIFL
jgi:hypothetical protein